MHYIATGFAFFNTELSNLHRCFGMARCLLERDIVGDIEEQCSANFIATGGILFPFIEYVAFLLLLDIKE